MPKPSPHVDRHAAVATRNSKMILGVKQRPTPPAILKAFEIEAATTERVQTGEARLRRAIRRAMHTQSENVSELTFHEGVGGGGNLREFKSLTHS